MFSSAFISIVISYVLMVPIAAFRSCYERIQASGNVCRIVRSKVTQGRKVVRPQYIHTASPAASSLLDYEDVDISFCKSEVSESRAYFPIYYNDVYEVKLPPNHRFPMEKYEKVRKKIQQLISADLSPENNNRDDDVQQQQHCLRSKPHTEFRMSPLAAVDDLTTTHCSEYVNRFINGRMTEAENRNVGFPWSPSGVNRARSSVGGTIAAARSVCNVIRYRRQQRRQQHRHQGVVENHEHGNGDFDNKVIRCSPPLIWSAHVAGGTHHAFYDYGEGFCVFSDIAVAANVVLRDYPDIVKHILIIDLDVHQGNGNAVLFQNKPEVSTFSIHCNANYFSPKQSSDLDIELPVDCNDGTYISTLRYWLKRIDEEVGTGTTKPKFDLVFFQAGVDILHHDRLGRMSLSSKGIERRNELVFDFVRKNNIPLVITMGGGYPKTDTSWKPIIDAHANVYFQAYQYLSSPLP